MASNFFNKASLVMVPDAPIDGKLPSVKPEDRSGDFTFSRGSNLAATRVNKSGLIEKGRENLLLQSNQFDTTWVNASSSETSGQMGYDGSSDAWLLNKSGSGGRIYQNVAVSGLHTFSVYAKAGTLNWVSLWTNIGTSYFDLENGVVGDVTASTSITSNIESVGNGWYRCSFVFNTTISQVRIYLADGNLDTSGTSGSIYIQDAQLEQGLAATDYIETTTAAVQKGILENLPRIDYSGGASCPSLLLEPQRTNYYTNSEYFSGAGWTIGRGVLTYNDAISPEGLSNAVKWQVTSDTGAHYLRQSRTSSDTWSISIFVKKGNYRYVGLRCAASNAAFDLDTGTFSSGSGYVEPLDNGWYRIGLTETGNGTFQYYGVYYANSDATERNDATGNEYYHIYGAQQELGSYPTSYIPAYGSSVTRSADSGVSDVDSLLTSNATYTWMAEFIVPEIGNGGGEITFKDAGGLSQLRIYCNQNSMVGLRVDENSQNYYIPVSVGDTAKCLFQCTNGLVKGFYNGALVKTFTIDTGMDAQKIHLGPPVSAPKVKQIALFGTALTDDECIALTTI